MIFIIIKRIEKEKIIKVNGKLTFTWGIGDWGLGIGDWGLGIGPQSPIPNPQSPKPNFF